MTDYNSIGAAVPFLTYEAEEARLLGGATPGRDPFIREASSGKAYVHLPAPGDGVEFVTAEPADRITVRYSVPYRSEATLEIRVAGQAVCRKRLNALQCHGVNPDGTLDDGVRSYTEFTVSAEVAANDTVALLNRGGDISVDLVDMETAPAPLPKPEGALSIVEFGAVPDGDTDDTDAIEACFAAAAEQHCAVYIPPGTFLQSRKLTLPPDIALLGAGLWYSAVEFTAPGHTFSKNNGYAMTRGNRIAGIRFNDRASFSRGNASILLHPFGSDQVVEDCQFSNVGCVFGWDGECCRTVFRRNRVIGTYFDGTHWGDGRYADNEICDNFFRGVGDDAIAQVNRADMGLCERNTAHHNTVIAGYWGRGISDVGGKTLTLTHNRVDSAYLAGLIVTTEHLGSSVSRPIEGLRVEHNLFRRCGHRPFDERSRLASNLATVHFCLMTNPMSDVIVKGNSLLEGETAPIVFDKTAFDNGGATVTDNRIEGFTE